MLRSSPDLPLADAVTSYLFNSQLLQVPGEDRLVLLAPIEVQENPRARAAAEAAVAGNGPIGRIQYVDVRQSMRNGGGPACLRLRVVLTPEELTATLGEAGAKRIMGLGIALIVGGVLLIEIGATH